MSRNFTFMRNGIGLDGMMPSLMLQGGPDPKVTVDAVVRKAFTGIVVQAVIRNRSHKTVRVRNVLWARDMEPLWPPPALVFADQLQPFYYSSENYRGEVFGTGTMVGTALFYPLTNQDITVGLHEDWVFPGVFIGSATSELGMLIAAAEHRQFSLKFRFRGGSGLGRWNLEIEQYPQGLEYLELKPGQSLATDGFFVDISRTNDPQRATGSYYRQLRKNGHFKRMDINPLHTQRIWQTWNYGTFFNIDEHTVLKQIPLIKRYFPSVNFLQIDCGYEAIYPSGQIRQADLLYGKGPHHNTKKFPHGMKFMADAIRARGLRPAIWLALWGSGSSQMMRDHPEWALRDEAGRPMRVNSKFGIFNDTSDYLVILDPSVPGYHAYVERVARTVFTEWGFEGVKLDFS
ncbi:MAG: hypothetical protein ABIF71_02170 [Planctomycetota bacterium]